jgi:hypothetical protein
MKMRPRIYYTETDKALMCVDVGSLAERRIFELDCTPV